MAVQRAKKLNLPLVFRADKFNDFMPIYKRLLESSGSPAEFEYSESGGVTNGNFHIREGTFQVLYRPRKKPTKDLLDIEHTESKENSRNKSIMRNMRNYFRIKPKYKD